MAKVASVTLVALPPFVFLSPLNWCRAFSLGREVFVGGLFGLKAGNTSSDLIVSAESQDSSPDTTWYTSLAGLFTLLLQLESLLASSTVSS